MHRRPSPATLIASLALFFSLAGTGLAAQHYLITSLSQIAPNVRHRLHGARGLTGPQGPMGNPGPQGAVGPRGGLDFSNTYVVDATFTMTSDRPRGAGWAFCHPGDHALTGGFAVDASAVVIVSAMASDKDAWVIVAHLAPSESEATGHAWALCAPSTQS